MEERIEDRRKSDQAENADQDKTERGTLKTETAIIHYKDKEIHCIKAIPQKHERIAQISNKLYVSKECQGITG